MSAELLIRLPDYFPSLINAMQDGFVLRGTDGTIIEVNHAFCDMVGLDRSEIVGSRPPHAWWPEDMRGQFEDAVKRFLTGVSTEGDLIFRRHNGDHFPALITNSPLRDNEDRIVAYIGTVRDMSERVKAEEQIRFQAALIDQVEAGVIATDATGRIVSWNRGAEALYGWQHQEVIGKPGQDLLLGPDAEATVAELVQTLNSGQPWEGEIAVPHRDGSIVPVFVSSSAVRDQNNRPTGIVGVVVDISDRKRHEQEQAFLSEASRVLASSLDYRETMTSVAQLAVPTIADWCVVHAVDYDGKIGQLAVAHVNPEKVEWARAIQERYPTNPNAPTGVPNVIRTGQSEIYPHISDELLVAAARDEEHLALIREVGFTSAMVLPIVAREKVLGVITFVSAELGRHYGDRDLALAQHLADRSAVAIDNALLYEEAQEAARSRDQFLAVAAHELRSPLTSMKGFAQLLLRRANRTPGGAEWITPLQTIDAQVNRVTVLVSRLLDVSRIEEKRLQLQVAPVDMVEVVRGAAVEAQLATEHHSVAARFAEESLIANIDRTRIEQVLANLLDNAVKYSPVGTSVEIVLRADGNDLVVAVSDQGPGIPADAQQRMFERYFRGTSSSRAASEGLGLGLYVAHGIVTAHGGRMSVSSEGGHGTTFSFSLPRATRNATRQPQTNDEAVEG